MKRPTLLNRGEVGIILAGLFVLAVMAAYHFGHAKGALFGATRLPPDFAFAAALSERYGSSRNSEDLEEWIIRDFFQDERGGVFLDVGANHHRERSNTYYLETALDWSGVAIEAQARFADGYRQFRPRTAFVPLFVADKADQDAVLYIPTDGLHLVASENKAFAESFGASTEAVTVRTTTLDVVLDQLRVQKIDFLTMDIELAEPKALAGFSIGRFRPRLVGIEAHAGVQQQILEYFLHNQYVLVGKYLGVDRDNYWFAPRGSVRDDVTVDGHKHL